MEKKENIVNNGTHTNMHLTFPLFFVVLLLRRKKKKAFHDINLSNSENTEGARWMCSRLQSVLVSLVNRESFRSLFPSTESSSHLVYDDSRNGRQAVILRCPTV